MALAQPGPMILPGARNVDVDNLEYKSAGRDIHGPTINLTIASPPEISSRSLFEEIRSLLGLFSDHTGPTDEPRSRHELKAGSPSVKSIPSLKVLDLDHDLASAASPDTSKNVMTSGPARDAQRELNTSESVRSNPRAPSEVDDATENEDFKARYTSELDPRPLEGLTTPQIYVYSMLGSGRGLACWKPCTHNSVSSRRRVFPSISDSESTAGWGGVIPGDVGTYDAERGFSKVFNLWEDDEAIRSMAKDIYQRIYTTPDDDIKISESDFRRGDTVAQGASAEVNDSGDGEFIEGFEFQVHPGSSQGALLAVTSAADQLEVLDLGGLHDHICSNAELLYRYTITRRRLGPNESLIGQ
ncbi:hypothetical protein DFP72DRAFT_514486 [Ephemerocybe angulata]|uniref:Uncharacterized protein n=1 Tax=Ephemerocybe angulata TaxID=980116 RepID=A0A8H6M323_9AGAR|nr:hypothetical protein DFP72DRAFT_514486 [Tulosesus angulatus]